MGRTVIGTAINTGGNAIVDRFLFENSLKNARGEMGEVIYGIDFRKKRDDEIRQQAGHLLSLIECANDQVIYESTLGWFSQSDDVVRFEAPYQDPA